MIVQRLKSKTWYWLPISNRWESIFLGVLVHLLAHHQLFLQQTDFQTTILIQTSRRYCPTWPGGLQTGVKCKVMLPNTPTCKMARHKMHGGCQVAVLRHLILIIRFWNVWTRNTHNIFIIYRGGTSNLTTGWTVTVSAQGHLKTKEFLIYKCSAVC
jgi:hypothetical protein